MDFGYKVIKNRLGSLVANAIQKKIKDAKGTDVKVTFKPAGSGVFSWNNGSRLSTMNIYEIDDIRIASGASTSNINLFVIGWHTITKAGDFWVHDGNKIEGTTGSTVISDSILWDLVKKDILDVKYFTTPSIQSLNHFEIHFRTVTAFMTIDGYKYNFPTTSQIGGLLTQ